MQTPTNETTDPVIACLKAQAELTRIEAEKLWKELEAAEKAMEPFKLAYEAIRSKWAVVYNTNKTLTQILSQRTTQEGK